MIMAKREKKEKRTDERFATKAVIAIAIFTVVFIAADIAVYLITGSEMVTLTEWYFRGVVIECGAMMLKRIAEVIVGRIEKNEGIKIEKSEGEFDGNEF